MASMDRNPRCGEHCCDRYWAFPERCVGCGIGLIHQGYGELWVNPDGTRGPGKDLILTCDSCDHPTYPQHYISTCPSGFTKEDAARDRAFRASL
jgi:hypothetical protein